MERLSGLVADHARRVAARKGPLARVLDCKLAAPEDIGVGRNNDVAGQNGSNRRLDRLGSHTTADGLALPRISAKFVLESGMLFVFSAPPRKARLLEALPLSLCALDDAHSPHPSAVIANDATAADTSTSEPRLTLFSTADNGWLLTLYLDSEVTRAHWEDALCTGGAQPTLYAAGTTGGGVDANSASDGNSNGGGASRRSDSRPPPMTQHLEPNGARGSGLRQRSATSHRRWAQRSQLPTPILGQSVSALSPEEVRTSMDIVEMQREQLKRDSNAFSARQGAFQARLEGQMHLFGAEVGWRRLKLVSKDGKLGGSSVDDEGGHRNHHHNTTRHPMHTGADAAEREAVRNDEEFLLGMARHPHLRETALSDDSPLFQKHIAALQEQVRGVKHNAQKLLASSTHYFNAGRAFAQAGHRFAQDMLRFAPYQRDEWELGGGKIGKGKSKLAKQYLKGGTGDAMLTKDLWEDQVRTRKMAIVSEELTLLIREGMVHLEVLLGQQEEVLVKPLQHLVQVDSKVCKQAKERYDREKKSYLQALSKYQSMKRGKTSASVMATAKREAARHAKIYEDARFDAALKLGVFDAVRDTRYLEQLSQWLHVQLSFFTHGEKLLGERSPYLVSMYSSVALANEDTDRQADSLRHEFDEWKRKQEQDGDDAQAMAGSQMREDLKDGEDAGSSSGGLAGGKRRGRTSVTDGSGGLVSGGGGGGGGHDNVIGGAEQAARGDEAFYEGYLMIRSKTWKSKWKRRWFTCDGRQFWYCKTAAQDAVRACEIDLTMASIRPARGVPRDFCFEVVSSAPGGGVRIMVMQAASAEEMAKWMAAIVAGISAQLDALAPSSVSGTGNATRAEAAGEDGAGGKLSAKAARERQLQMIGSTEGNSKCADCDATAGVEWCSLNLGVVLCLECAGVHRGLGVHVSQVSWCVWTDVCISRHYCGRSCIFLF